MKEESETIEQARRDIEWLLRALLAAAPFDDEDDEDHVNAIARRWNIK